jgi:hypothetical protein
LKAGDSIRKGFVGKYRKEKKKGVLRRRKLRKNEKFTLEKKKIGEENKLEY